MKKNKTKVAETPSKVETPAKNKTIAAEDISALKNKVKEVAAEKENSTKAVQKIQYERELKWKYPEGLTDTIERKVFRQKSRNKIRRMESAALKLEAEAKNAKMAEIQAFREQVLVDPNATV